MPSTPPAPWPPLPPSGDTGVTKAVSSSGGRQPSYTISCRGRHTKGGRGGTEGGLKVDPEENQDKQRVGVEQNQKLRLPVDSRTYWFCPGTHQKRKFNGASQRSLKSLVFRVQLYPNRNGRARVQKCPGLSRRSQGSHEKTRFFSIQHFPILSPRLVSSTGLVPCVMLESSPLVCIWSILCPLFVWITVTIIQSSQFKINLSIISPVLTFQQLFEEEGVPITAEEVLDTNFKLKKKFHDIPVVSQNWIIPHFWIESQSQVRAPMGVHKRIHIQRICQLPEVLILFENGKKCNM